MERLEYDGIWKLPEYEDVELYGKLIVNDDITLEVIGDIPFELQDKKIDIIHGFTTNGKYITLINNFNKNTKLNYPGIDSYKYSARYLFIGKKINSIDELNIKSITSRYTNLEEWIGIYGFNFKMQKHKNFDINLNYKIPNKISYELDDFNLDINFMARQSGNLKDNYSISQYSNITFFDIEDSSFNSCMNIVNDFSNFISLCVGKNVKFYDVSIKDMDDEIIKVYTRVYKSKLINDSKMMNHEMFIPYNYIDEEFSTFLSRWYEKKDKLQPIISYLLEILINDSKMMNHEMFIPYNYIDEEFSTFLSRWYEKKDKLQPIISYLLEICDIKSYDSIAFIKAMQCLETFSRRMLTNCKDDEEYHNSRISYIISKIDNEEYKEWLTKKLEFSNEPTLGKRLNEILKETGFILNINEKRRKSIIKKLVDTRNYYTHFDESKKDKIMNGEELIWSIKYIVVLTKALLMIELGVSEEKIKERLCNVYSEKYVIDRFANTFEIIN